MHGAKYAGNKPQCSKGPLQVVHRDAHNFLATGCDNTCEMSTTESSLETWHPGFLLKAGYELTFYLAKCQNFRLPEEKQVFNMNHLFIPDSLGIGCHSLGNGGKPPEIEASRH